VHESLSWIKHCYQDNQKTDFIVMLRSWILPTSPDSDAFGILFLILFIYTMKFRVWQGS
jgi:hypothetical protein